MGDSVPSICMGIKPLPILASEMFLNDDNFKGQKGKTPINTKTNINVEFETSPKEIGCYSTTKVQTTKTVHFESFPKMIWPIL